MDGTGNNRVPWIDEKCDLATLRPRFAAIESKWTDYLSRLEEDDLPRNFDLREGEEVYSYPKGIQIFQLIGHAFYHRGQIALLVDQLGGEVIDTDYVDWALMRL
jgi:uncharacterized damage-inducible protein DinB